MRTVCFVGTEKHIEKFRAVVGNWTQVTFHELHKCEDGLTKIWFKMFHTQVDLAKQVASRNKVEVLSGSDYTHGFSHATAAGPKRKKA
jgi:hypothetical protein